MKVLLLSRHGILGPSSRQRGLSYIDRLQQAGIEVTVASFFDNDYLERLYSDQRISMKMIAKAYARRLKYLLKIHKFDVVWVEVEALPWLPSFVEKLLLGDTPYLVDMDDAWFQRYRQHPNPVVRAVLGGKLDKLVKGASQVVVGSDYLRDYVKSVSSTRCVKIPTVVDIDQYEGYQPAKNKKTVIGWIGTPSSERYLTSIESALSEVCQKRDAILRIVGARPVELSSVPTEFRPWSIDTEASEVAQFDIGIMPLDDGSWARGKCGYKIIQYMAAGRPSVSSSIGENRHIVEDGVTGFLVDHMSKWKDRLIQLIDDDSLCQDMGNKAFDVAKKNFSRQATTPYLVDALLRASHAKYVPAPSTVFENMRRNVEA